jgi:hypothetical protein
MLAVAIWVLAPMVAHADSATWDLNPGSGDWNTAANWTPNGVPNGPADTATFGLSNTTDVSISAGTEVNGITLTAAATNPYAITASSKLTLTISGVGITNNSGTTQNFATVAGGEIHFTNNATGGSNVSISNEGGTTNFSDHSSAAGASISNEAGGTTNFFDRSTGGASNSNGGTTNFFDRSTADSIFNNGGGGTTNFFDRSTAGSATIRNFNNDPFTFIPTTSFFNRSTAGNSTILNLNGSVFFANNSTAASAFIDLDSNSGLQFANNSTAGNSTISTFKSARVAFLDNSTAGSASIFVLDASVLQFVDTSTAASASIFAAEGFISFEGSSQGGTARIALRQGPFPSTSVLDISGHNAPGVTIGSLEGGEGDEFSSTVALGANNLTVGSNNLNTTFSGVIQDGGINGGIGVH